MICPKCGNQVSSEEVFCGQCGTPMTPNAAPVPPDGTANASPPHSGLLSSYHTQMVPPSGTYPPRSGALPAPNGYNPASPAQSGNAFIADQQMRMAGPPPQPQESGFYQDATEAISALPPNYSGQGYPQQGLPPGSMQGGNYP